MFGQKIRIKWHLMQEMYVINHIIFVLYKVFFMSNYNQQIVHFDQQFLTRNAKSGATIYDNKRQVHIEHNG